MRRILFVDNTPAMGGSVHHLASQIRNLRQLGYEMRLIASNPDLFKGLLPEGVDVVTLAWPGFRNVFESSEAMLRGYLPGILNWPLSWMSYRRMERSLVPDFLRVLSDWHPDLVHINNLNLPNKVFGDAVKSLGLPLVVSVMMIRPFSRREASFAAMADALVSVSEAVSECVARLPGVKRDRLRVAENGVDASRYEAPRDPSIRAALGIPQSARIVLSLGRMIEWKGHDVLVRAVAALPADVWLVQAGGDESVWRRKIERLAEDTGLTGRFVIAGVRSEVPELLAACDVLVHSSKFRTPDQGVVEAFGRVIIEAMASGRPVVATNAGGVPEILAGTEAGRLVEPGDDKAMAEALRFYLDNPTEAKRAGEIGREVVRKRFDEAVLARKLAEVYERLLAPIPA